MLLLLLILYIPSTHRSILLLSIYIYHHSDNIQQCSAPPSAKLPPCSRYACPLPQGGLCARYHCTLLLPYLRSGSPVVRTPAYAMTVADTCYRAPLRNRPALTRRAPSSAASAPRPLCTRPRTARSFTCALSSFTYCSCIDVPYGQSPARKTRRVLSRHFTPIQ